MEKNIILPDCNEYGYYEIRLESIGGLGANLCGKMLGELGALYLKLNAASFSSYGSEKRGSPVKAFIRYANPETEIRSNSPVRVPNILGLFHEAMIGKMAVTAGVNEKTKIVINTNASPEDIRDRLKLCAGEVICIDAQRLAMETKSRVNMIMLGAIAKATGFIDFTDVEKMVRETIGKKYPELLKSNLEGVKRGYEEGVNGKFTEDGRYAYVPFRDTENEWGYANAPIGGVNPRFGSTITNDLSASREGYIPLFEQEKCIHCGLCDSTCPDMVFRFEEVEENGKKKIKNCGLDYHHCKGCLRCVQVCPTHALRAGLEREQEHLHWFVRNKDLITEPLEYEDVGANSWVTSESYLQEKRVDGGVL